MARKCQVTGKRHSKGRNFQYRGIAKKQKGIGLNITGWCKRQFRPNLHKKRFWFPEENRWITLRLSSHGIRIIDKLGIAAIVKKMRAEGQKI